MPKISIDINQEALAYFERGRDELNARHQAAHTLEECVSMAVNNFPQLMADWNELSSFAVEQAHNARNLERESRKALMYQLSYEQALEDKAAAIRKAVSENARRASRCRKSPYAKTGTREAVYRVIEERKTLLNRRGGKAELNRIILGLIIKGKISAPNTPTPKTVDRWIDDFNRAQNTQN